MKNAFIVKLCLSFILYVVIDESVATEKSALTMFTWSINLEPILYSTHEQDLYTKTDLTKYKGIVAEVLKSASDEFPSSIEVVLTGRIRGERELYDGKYDFTILSPKWLKQPENLIYSEPLYIHKEFLYSLNSMRGRALDSVIQNAVVCTQVGFKYPKLEPYFKSGKARRLDSTSEEISFKLLLRGRCDYVVTNEFVADAIIAKNDLNRDIFTSEFLIENADFVFAFHPKHKDLLPAINKHLNHYIATGKMETVICEQRKRAVEVANRFVEVEESAD